MAGLQTIQQAAESAGVSRNTIARWLKAGLLKGKAEQRGHLTATLVNVADVRRVAKQRRPGRPRKG